MSATPQLQLNALQKAEEAADEAMGAALAYHRWMADWRARHGHHGPCDAMGLPLKEARALAGTEGA